MPTITNYSTLVQAVTDFAHRADLATGNFVDYFIQDALEQIAVDIPDLNFGNYIKLMEAAYAPSNTIGGVTPIPADWLGPKVFTVSDGSNDSFTLIFKAAAWIYDNYPVRQASGLPAYIARDLQPATSFTATLNTAGVLAISAVASGMPTPGMILTDTVSGLPATTPGNAVIISGQTSGVSGSTGNYTAASCNPLAPTYTLSAETMTGGGGVFIFGPYPDSAYTIAGTYYQKIPALNSGSTTNWVVLNAPMMLHAACMAKAGMFLKDAAMAQLWQPIYEQKLKALVDQDKAERWAASTLQIEAS